MWPAAFALLLLTAPAESKLSQEIALCAAIEGDLARLVCFDKLASTQGLNAPAAQPFEDLGETGAWFVDSKVNPIDDSPKVTLHLLAKSGTSRRGLPISLLIQCTQNRVEAFIAWDDYLGREAEVLTRIGKKKATTLRWHLSTDSQASFHPKPIPFVNELLEANSLVAQITPYNESPTTAVFDTTGLGKAIEPLLKACGHSE